MANIGTGRYEEAIAAGKRAIIIGPDDFLSHLALAGAYSLAGQQEEARAEAEEVLRINPKFSVEYIERTLPYKNKEDLERVIGAARMAGLPEKPPLPRPDKPSIAVLPFVNMSGDPEQEYFSDGMAEDLITDLSKISGLLVISRNSTFAYKGKSIETREIAQKLGVKYVVEGSVRKAGMQVRINAQLIDAATGHHLWADRYDGRLEEVFTLQDRITQRIVSALAVKLTTGEQKSISTRETNNIEAHDAYLKGMDYQKHFTAEQTAKALSCFKDAVELDPKYGRAYAGLGRTYWYTALTGLHMRLGMSRQEAMLRARHYAELALEYPNSLAYSFISILYRIERRYEESIAHAERALALEPNDAKSNQLMAYALTGGGRPGEAIEFAKRSLMVDPGCVF
jgi:TolB-like protein